VPQLQKPAIRGASCTSYADAPGTGSQVTIGESVLAPGSSAALLLRRSRLGMLGVAGSNVFWKGVPTFQTPDLPSASKARTRQ